MSDGDRPSIDGLTVGAVAELTGVSVRTLHHYDHIGLVVPSERTPAGYRTYRDADIERLHQVLTYRELGFALEQIAALLDDPTVDATDRLRAQHDLLTGRIDRLHRMVAAVEKMMNTRKTGLSLTAAEQAEIFGTDWPGEEYAAEAEERWGDTDTWQQSQQRTARYTAEDWKRIKAETESFEERLATAMREGIAPGSTAANELAEEHRATIGNYYDCSHEMQVNLAQMYVADPRFTAHYDEREPGLAQYLHDVIVANAQ